MGPCPCAFPKPHLLFGLVRLHLALPHRTRLRFVARVLFSFPRYCAPLSHDTPPPHRTQSMELISQLFNAVTGAGTAPQNDVRTHISTFLNSAFDRLSKFRSRPAAIGVEPNANTMRHQANDASHEAGDLPPLPFGAGSSPSRSTHIDLTSPTRESPPQKQQARGDTDQRLPKTRHKKNEHERRLVGDYEYERTIRSHKRGVEKLTHRAVHLLMLYTRPILA